MKILATPWIVKGIFLGEGGGEGNGGDIGVVWGLELAGVERNNILRLSKDKGEDLNRNVPPLAPS